MLSICHCRAIFNVVFGPCQRSIGLLKPPSTEIWQQQDGARHKIFGHRASSCHSRWVSSAFRWPSLYCRVSSDEIRWDRLSQFCWAIKLENCKISGPTKNVASVATICLYLSCCYRSSHATIIQLTWDYLICHATIVQPMRLQVTLYQRYFLFPKLHLPIPVQTSHKWVRIESVQSCCPGSASLAILKWYSFCLFVVVSQLLWRRVGWELPGYFRLIFHICITRFNNSVTHEISVMVRFILCETIMACFLLGRLLISLTAGIVLVVSSDM